MIYAQVLPGPLPTSAYNNRTLQSHIKPVCVIQGVYRFIKHHIFSFLHTHTQSPFVPFQYLLPLLWPFTIQMLKLLFLFYFCILYLHDQLWKEYFDHVWIGHVGAIKINELYLWESSNYSWIFRLFFFYYDHL